MLSKIPGNVEGDPENIQKDSGECLRKFRGIIFGDLFFKA